MELDDLQHIWHSGASQPATGKATRALLDEITQKKYKSKMKKIRIPELSGSLICIAAAVFITFYFHRLHTGLLQGVGVAAIILLVLLPVISYLSLKQLAIAGNAGAPYAEAMQVFARQKLTFYRLQKLNVTLSCALLVVMVILLAAFFDHTGITNSKSFWVFSFTIGYLVLLFFSTLVSRYYKGIIRQTEALLQEVENEYSK